MTINIQPPSGSAAPASPTQITQIKTDLALNNVTNVAQQPLNADLTAIAALTPTNDDVLQRKAGSWVNRTMAQLKADLAIVAADLSDFASGVRAAVLTGIDVATTGAVSAADSVMAAIGKLQATKADVLAPGSAITTSGNLTRALHGNRFVPVTVAGTTQTLPNDATAGWVNDDSIELAINAAGAVTTLAGDGSTGKSTLVVPVGYKATAGQNEVLTAIRTGPNQFASTTPNLAVLNGGSAATPYQSLRQRRDTAANWTAANPVLALGEIGYESDTGKVKFGDGATAWNALAYFAPGATPQVTVYSGGNIACPQDAANNTILTQAIPGDKLGINGFLEFDLLFGRDVAAANDTFLQVFYGTQLIGVASAIVASSRSYHSHRRIDNMGATNSQVIYTIGAVYGDEVQNTVDMYTSAIDTTAAQNFVVKAQNGGVEASAHLTLFKWSVKLHRVP